MAKIITVTANSAIDFFIEIDHFAAKSNMLAKRSHEFFCGKGINVAKAIISLNTPVTCLGFVGDQSLSSFNRLGSELLYADFTAVKGKTRTNITLFDTSAHDETHIRTPGFSVTENCCKQLIDKIDETASASDIVILSGSLPAGKIPDNYYQTIIELCRNKSVLSILDSSGKGLYHGLKASPWLIKPNLQELEELTGSKLPDENAIVEAGTRLINQDTEWVYVSCGKQGVIVIGEHTVLTARVNKLSEKVRSHVGCGDAMIAGLVVARSRGLGLQDTVKLAVACGTANLFETEPGQFNPRLLPEISRHIEIRRL